MGLRGKAWHDELDLRPGVNEGKKADVGHKDIPEHVIYPFVTVTKGVEAES